MLEDAGGLFDEAATVLRGGMQDPVELPLADDHVHFAAEAGVGEQFLDVQQPAARTVDGVFGAAGAEQGAGDGDFAVLDGEGAVGIVDRQRDVRTAQRRPAGGARENNVFHLSAAEGLGALFAHDPGQGVDHIGLARAVGADHGGDAWFEFEGRRRCERLESPDGQALEMQGISVLLAGGLGTLFDAGMNRAAVFRCGCFPVRVFWTAPGTYNLLRSCDNSAQNPRETAVGAVCACAEPACTGQS